LRAAIAAAFLLGCGASLPAPNYPPTPQEATEQERLAERWVAHGYARPEADCMDGLRIALVTPEVYAQRCRKDPTGITAPACALCSGGWIFSPRCTPVTVMLKSDEQRRFSITRHEMLHHFERCAGYGHDYNHERPYWAEILSQSIGDPDVDQ